MKFKKPEYREKNQVTEHFKRNDTNIISFRMYSYTSHFFPVIKQIYIFIHSNISSPHVKKSKGAKKDAIRISSVLEVKQLSNSI